MNSLHPSVQKAIDASGSRVVVHDHSSFEVEIKSPNDFSQAVGLPLERISKSLFLRRRDGGHLVAVLGMTQRVDFKKLAVFVGAKHVDVASPEELQATLGYPRNGVSPIGISEDVVVIMDRALFGYPTITVGGGAMGIEVELAPYDVCTMSGATVTELAIETD